MELFDSLFDDEILIWRPQTSVASAVADHLALREAYEIQLATLVVPDGQLAEVARHIPAGMTVPVSVITSGGAGGLLGLARRNLAGIAVVSAEPALRDLDDLAGSATRVVSAATQLDSDIAIFVELPYAPGWQTAIELVEAAGRYAKIATDEAEPRQTAEQLSVLIEADLPFKITSRPGDGWLALLAAVGALIDGASIDDAAALMQVDRDDQVRAVMTAWQEMTPSRIRRRVRRLGTDRVREMINDYVAEQ
jgi:hypothetical protein